MNHILRYVKSDTTLRIDKIWYVFVRQKSYMTLHCMVHISIKSVPHCAKSDMTLHMLHICLSLRLITKKNSKGWAYMVHISINRVPQYVISHATYVKVYVPMNLSSRFGVHDS